MTQSGLSWRTVLNKRESFRKSFHNFNFDKVALFSEKDVKEMLDNKDIIRHRGKIEAVINNARRAQEIVNSEGSLASFLWSYKPDDKCLLKPQSSSTSQESIALSKELKSRGWKFLGPTTVYAFMQAMGLINDHIEGCVIRSKVEKARKEFTLPN